MVLFAGSLSAQTTGAPVAAASAVPGASPNPVSPPVTVGAPALPPLPQTMTLSVQGSLTQTLAPVDLALAVSGPDFSISTMLGNSKNNANQIRMTFSGTVQLVDEKYLVNYALRWQVPYFTMNMDRTPTVSYRNLGVEGAALLRAGQPVTILNDQGKKLTLTIKYPAKSAVVVAAK